VEKMNSESYTDKYKDNIPSINRY